MSSNEPSDRDPNKTATSGIVVIGTGLDTHGPAIGAMMRLRDSGIGIMLDAKSTEPLSHHLTYRPDPPATIICSDMFNYEPMKCDAPWSSAKELRDMRSREENERAQRVRKGKRRYQ